MSLIESAGPFRNSSISWIFLWRFPIQNLLKPPITEKRRNKAKYLIWNSIGFKFLGKTSMPNLVESLVYINCYSSSSSRPVKNPSNLKRLLKTLLKRPTSTLETRKKATSLYMTNNAIIYKFFKDFTNHRKKTNGAVVFSCIPFPSILKYRDHWWELLTIWKTRLFQTLEDTYSYWRHIHNNKQKPLLSRRDQNEYKFPLHKVHYWKGYYDIH